ncbi:MAG: hypothetical protein K2M90_07820 [Treponemataceae bacterium]|nr:hypothetical protein [Treponemataceae bacterium]MDE7392345.1 hypothetical protein [Treponemataceae bacterium]
MKRTIVAALLVLVCLPVFYAEIFYDGDDFCGVDCIGKSLSQQQILSMLELYKNVYPSQARSRFVGYIQKVSQRETYLINKALSKYTLEKDEVYQIFIAGNNNRSSIFMVSITDVKKQNYHYQWIGIRFV